MRTVMVRYKVKADRADENRAYIEQVFAELAASDPGGLSYASFVLDDGVSFVHVARIEGEANPLGQTAAFKAFQAEIKERCEEPPQATPLNAIGGYRFFGG